MSLLSSTSLGCYTFLSRVCLGRTLGGEAGAECEDARYGEDELLHYSIDGLEVMNNYGLFTCKGSERTWVYDVIGEWHY